MFPPPKFDLLGVQFSRVNLDTATEAILRAVREKHKGYVTVSGVHGIIEAQDDPSLRAIFNGSFMTTPDGMPTVWEGKKRGFSEMSRVYGPDLMLRLFESTQDGAVRHFFYGGRPGVAEKLRENLEMRFPGVQVCGIYCPPFRPLDDAEAAALEKQVADSGADIIWVGISTPKQERFMAAYSARLEASILIGVGAAFDFHAGLVHQAPIWIQRNGLEWLFRLCVEPRRLWKRYFSTVPRYLWLIALDRLKKRWRSTVLGSPR